MRAQRQPDLKLPASQDQWVHDMTSVAVVQYYWRPDRVTRLESQPVNTAHDMHRAGGLSQQPGNQTVAPT